MTPKKFISNFGNLTFIIEDYYPEIGSALYICENKKVIRDYFQDSAVICKNQANRLCGVPMDNWVEMTDFDDYPWLIDL